MVRSSESAPAEPIVPVRIEDVGAESAYGETFIYTAGIAVIALVIYRRNEPVLRHRALPLKNKMPPNQYGGYDHRLVTEWARVPSNGWLYLLREKKSDLVLVGFSSRMESSAPILFYAEIIICNNCLYSSVCIVCFCSSTYFICIPG
ncbi:hypothetical protein TNCV_1744081 [Trichonephila clavipes]|nr:hypothetical protein TNCV_1744081 [Trichonephila clavipes]